MIRVKLGEDDQKWATEVGRRRWKSSSERGSRPNFPDAKEIDHIDGAGAELAFCRALKLTWPASVDTFTSQPDVYPNWEIRSLRNMSGVKVRPADKDPDDRLVVWVRGSLPTYEVMGYIRAGGARRHPEWKKDPGKRGSPIWLVPEGKMVPIDSSFHTHHGFAVNSAGVWACAYCGALSSEVS